MNQHNITRQENFIFIHFLANTERKNKLVKTVKKGGGEAKLLTVSHLQMRLKVLYRGIGE